VYYGAKKFNESVTLKGAFVDLFGRGQSLGSKRRAGGDIRVLLDPLHEFAHRKGTGLGKDFCVPRQRAWGRRACELDIGGGSSKKARECWPARQGFSQEG